VDAFYLNIVVPTLIYLHLISSIFQCSTLAASTWKVFIANCVGQSRTEAIAQALAKLGILNSAPLM
jgi:hypothetical protein